MPVLLTVWTLALLLGTGSSKRVLAQEASGGERQAIGTTGKDHDPINISCVGFDSVT